MSRLRDWELQRVVRALPRGGGCLLEIGAGWQAKALSARDFDGSVIRIRVCDVSGYDGAPHPIR